MLTAAFHNLVQIRDASNGAVLQQLNGHTGRVTNGALSSDGRWVVTSSDDATARVWDVASGVLLHELKGTPDP